MRSRMIAVAAMLVSSACYASHGPATARVDGLSVEDGWMEGDFGAIRGVSAAAYQIDVTDRRPDGQPWVSLRMHSGARGGDAHGWAMIGLGLRGMSLDEASWPEGTHLRFAGEPSEPSEPSVALWACSGAGHDLQEFEANAIDLEVRVLATVDGREVVFEAEVEDAQRVRGGFTLRRAP